ncbi:hypothetical protein AVEN_274331-1 [Araneus ventricosus]|uniref:Uncharacterized protein n=1 Tax=Araneus ventricosus TaxID=182803 RepID=A0A4Y2V3C3_ARAVE|nr:hypothetical protein AVEN_274331-1 [Araneus ventricosus]
MAKVSSLGINGSGTTVQQVSGGPAAALVHSAQFPTYSTEMNFLIPEECINSYLEIGSFTVHFMSQQWSESWYCCKHSFSFGIGTTSCASQFYTANISQLKRCLDSLEILYLPVDEITIALLPLSETSIIFFMSSSFICSSRISLDL